MATELTVQSERAFQKQPHIFLNHKAKASKSKKVGAGGRRWYKDIGLGFKTPKEAINGSYIGTMPQDLKHFRRTPYSYRSASDIPSKEFRQVAQITNTGILQTRNAPSPVWFLFEVESSRAKSFPRKCTELSSSAVNTSTSFRNTPDMRRDIQTLPLTSAQRFVWRTEIQLQWDSADR